jgi:hypothetical protein
LRQRSARSVGRPNWRAFAILAGNVLSAQIVGDVIGMHDLSPSGISPVKGRLPGACYYCHAPHSGIGGLTPLWNQKLSTQVYTTYTSLHFHRYRQRATAAEQSQHAVPELPRWDGSAGTDPGLGRRPHQWLAENRRCAGGQLTKLASVQHGAAAEGCSIPGGVAGSFRQDPRQDRSGDAHQG